MVRSRSSQPMGLLAYIALVCVTLLNPFTVYAEPAPEPSTPMKSVPIHWMPRRYSTRQDTLDKFRPANNVQLRFIEASSLAYASGACHQVDMNVELKSEDQTAIPSLNPFSFQNAIKKYSCTGTGANLSLDLEFDPQYADQIARWNVGSEVFGIVIPHDFVDLKRNKACFSTLSTQARESTSKYPMETVVKLVKDPKFLNPRKRNVVTFTVVKTDIWSQMNRVQSVHIAHREMDSVLSRFIQKRSTAEEMGPMWNFDQALSSATQSLVSAQADMAWTQTCVKNLITGQMDCTNWGISSSKITGMTQINHSTRVDIKTMNAALTNDSNPLLTLTKVNVTTPSFTIISTPLIGFSLPGIFDLGANVGIYGSVSLNILVQATQDLLLNTGSASSCPWTIDWNGSLVSKPVVQIGTCTLPAAPKLISDPNQALSIKSGDNAFYLGPNPTTLAVSRVNTGNAILGAVPSALSEGSRQSAYVRLGINIVPALTLDLKIFGLSAVSAGVSTPINLGINTNWDTEKTNQCPANNLGIYADAQAALVIQGTFFGFTQGVPPLVSPPYVTPTSCIPI
ncbi:hypothetical protein FBU30_004299 [Linnemannia zychae]|nr:hypothetical protein FBU30_004299 [Linnemannia zychae]